jgi:hypothetical protein
MDDWIINFKLKNHHAKKKKQLLFFSYAIMPFFLGLILSFNLAH